MKKITKKVLVGLAIAAASTVALTGCSGFTENTYSAPVNDEDAGKYSDRLYERKIKLTDGREVTCVLFAFSQKGGASCDWDSAQTEGAN